MKKKLLNSMRVLLVAAGLGVGASAWADTETFGESKVTDSSNVDIVGTASNIDGTSNPKGIGSYSVFNNKSDKGLKLRSGSPLTINVNKGYKVTEISVYAYQNNETNKTITCDSYAIDGGTATEYSTPVSIPLNVKNASNQTVASFSTGEIDARSSVVFNFTNSGDGQNQIYAFIQVTYESLTKTVVNIPFIGTESTIENGATYDGTTGSMTFSQPSGNAFKITTNYMIVGTGSGTTTIAETDRAGYAHKAEGKNYDVVNISFSMVFGNTSGSNRAGFEVLDEDDNVIVTLMSSKWAGISSSENTFGLELGTDITTQTGNTTLWSQKTDFNLEFNYQTGKITCKTNNNATGKTISMDSTKPVVAKFVLKSQDSRGDDTRQPFFSNLIIKNTEGDYSSSQVSYTINYKAGDNVVKTVSGENVDGETITADAVIDGTEEGFVGNHYLITAATAPSITLDATAAENILNVPVRAPYTATLSVTTTINGVSSEENTPLTETDEKVCNWSFAYPIYAKKGDIYYACDETEYVQSGTFTNGETVSRTITYSTAETDIVGFTDVGENGTNNTYSGGAYEVTSSKLASCTLNSGVYIAQIYVVSKAGSGSNTRNEAVYVDETAVVSTPSNTFGLVSCPFTVTTDGATVYVRGASSGSGYNTDNVDYVLIKKLPETVSATIGTNGYATFASPYALDLTTANLPDGLTAYKAAVSGTTVTFSPIDQTVPANTGVLLQGEASETYSIPVVASGTTVENNEFLVNVSGTTFDADNNYYYFGLIKNEDKLIFGQFAPGTVAIPSDKAYLKVLKSSIDGTSSRELTITFGDETMGVQQVLGSEQNVNGYYNLSGQRVAQPTRGLYIVNGKKVILK